MTNRMRIASLALLLAMMAFSVVSAHDYLLWDPCGQNGASEFNQILVDEGYIGVYTSDINEYLENLADYKALIFFPECLDHENIGVLDEIADEIDEYLNNGGSLYWDGPYAAMGVDYYRDELFMFDMATCITEPFNMIYGESEDFETLRVATVTSYAGEIMGGDGCAFSAPVTCPEMAVVREIPYRAILTSYNFSCFRDGGPNPRANYVDAVMTWLTHTMDTPEISSPLPEKISSIEAYPNPFNVQTKINFVIPEPVKLQVTIYNLLGQPLETIFDDYVNAGSHSVTWNASNYATGIYFARLESERYTGCMKVILLK